MSRTDEMRGRGTERGGAGGGEPFIKWGDDYAWVEGIVRGSFNTKYGLAVTVDVTDIGGAHLSANGIGEDGDKFMVGVEAGMSVNIGTQSATLQGKITPDDEGKALHIAFEGWEEPQGGNRYRVFVVIDISVPAEGIEDAGRGQGASPLPF